MLRNVLSRMCQRENCSSQMSDSPLVEDDGSTLLPRWTPPLAREMPIVSANSWVTPTACFYIFNHSEPFDIDIKKWSVRVGGEVEHPLSLTLRQLKSMHQVEVTNTLECAGNGRAFSNPRVTGVQWERGAVGNAIFRGPRLADILARAKIRKTTKHIIFTGADSASHSEPRFVRSIPIEKALDPQTILATRMNESLLSREHGFPVRVIVPGWIGAASVKRVTALWAAEHEAAGKYMHDSYRLPLDPSAGDAGSFALTSLRVKSIITQPLNGQRVSPGPITIRGVAWAGEAQIARVEISTDAGVSWAAAHLERSRAKYAWRAWEQSWLPLAEGTHEIWARATDSTGQIQPLEPRWNARGYMWNGVDKVAISVTRDQESDI
jgi:sulfite oxidase